MYIVLRAALHEGPSHWWGQSMAKSSLVIGSILEIGPRGFTWKVKANFLKLYYYGWGTSYDTACAPKVGRYKNRRPLHGLEAVPWFQYKNIISLKYFIVNKSKAWNVAIIQIGPMALFFILQIGPKGFSQGRIGPHFINCLMCSLSGPWSQLGSKCEWIGLEICWPWLPMQSVP